MNAIFGPLVSSSDLDYHKAMFEEVFGLTMLSDDRMDSPSSAAVWGVKNQRTRWAVMGTPGSSFGVQIVQFEPGNEHTIRHRSAGLVPQAAKVIDFFVQDLTDSLERARAFGLVINDDIARYDSPEGEVLEAHAWVKDEIVCAMIKPPADMERRFSLGLGRPVSEPQSVSGPTIELQSSVEFFQNVLGFNVIYEYEVKDSNFGKMIGSDQSVHIRARNVGADLRAPYIGMIDYGLYQDGDDLIAPVALPVRGLLGVTVTTDCLSDVVASARTEQALVTEPASGGMPDVWPGGSCALLRAPNGMLIQVIQTD